VLVGALSPLRDVGPDDLRVRELVERLRRGAVHEVILATNPNVEGEATAVYVGRLVKPLGVRVSRLAQGLPAGSELEFTDDLTLRRAFEHRREF
jgi:recombination protein RecR